MRMISGTAAMVTSVSMTSTMIATMLRGKVFFCSPGQRHHRQLDRIDAGEGQGHRHRQHHQVAEVEHRSLSRSGIRACLPQSQPKYWHAA